MRFVSSVALLASVLAACGGSNPPPARDPAARARRSALVAQWTTACDGGDKQACSKACNELGPTSACAAACDAGDTTACDEGGSRRTTKPSLVAAKDGIPMLEKACKATAAGPGVDRRWHACAVLGETEAALGDVDRAKAAVDAACTLAPAQCDAVREDAARKPRAPGLGTLAGDDLEAQYLLGYVMELMRAADRGAFESPATAFAAIARDHGRIAAALPVLMTDDAAADAWRVAYDDLDELLRGASPSQSALHAASEAFLRASQDLSMAVAQRFGTEIVSPRPAPAPR